MPTGRGRTGTHAELDGLVVKIKDEPTVPDWPARVAKMRAAAERMQKAIDDFAEATKHTRWWVDGEDIARQLQDLVEENHDGNSVLDLVNDIMVTEEVPTCQPLKSSYRRVK
jgi:hypothetical protein